MAPRIFFILVFKFSFFFKYKTIETHARAFLPLNISAVGSVPVVCSDELVQTGLWVVWEDQNCTVHSISSQTNQEEEIECTKV